MNESFFQPRHESLRSPEQLERELAESIKEEQAEQLIALKAEKTKLLDLQQEAEASPGNDLIKVAIQKQLEQLHTLTEHVEQSQKDLKDALT